MAWKFIGGRDRIVRSKYRSGRMLIDCISRPTFYRSETVAQHDSEILKVSNLVLIFLSLKHNVSRWSN